jgi:hypothetical protein
MGRTSYILKQEDTDSIQEAVETYIYDNRWQKWAFALYKKTMAKTWFRVMYIAIWLVAGLTFQTPFGKTLLYLSLFYFVKLFLVLLASHIVQGFRWRKAYNDFKRNTGIYHIFLMDFRIMGRRFVKH